MRGRKVLELNPDHSIVQALNENFQSDEGNVQVRSAGDRLFQGHFVSGALSSHASSGFES